MSSGDGDKATPGFETALLTPLTDPTGALINDDTKRKNDAVKVQFNPEKLDISLTNNFTQSSGNSPIQLVDEASAQLSVELQFDTTNTGVDVRQKTGKIAAFLKPMDLSFKTQDKKKSKPPPTVVLFEWGAIAFAGYFDSYSESLEYFSADGVPLRAKISLSMTQHERNFEPQMRDVKGADGKPTGKKEAFKAEDVGKDPFGGDAVNVPKDPKKPIDNATAAANGIENPRVPDTDTVALPESGELGRPPAAFAEAGAALGGGLSAGAGLGAGIGGGFGAGAGAGIGIGGGAGLSAGASAGIGLSAGASAGFGASAGAGFGASAGAGFGASAGAGFGASAGAGFGASAGAGFGASAGTGSTSAAFSGLSVKPPTLELKPVTISNEVTAKTSTTGPVGLGGSVKTSAGASLSAKVGGKISFGSE